MAHRLELGLRLRQLSGGVGGRHDAAPGEQPEPVGVRGVHLGRAQGKGPLAVAGTPTDQACALIERLEGMDRGRYAAPVGWLGADGDGCLLYTSDAADE